MESYFAKQAAADSYKEAAAIMRRVYDEAPGNWPQGLQPDWFDDIWLVRKKASREPVGFVGWQTRKEGGKNVGYYSVGVLPEHRRQGMARQAVADVIREKRAGVDAVRAMVVASNKPSLALADSLGVSVKKADARSTAVELAENAAKSWLHRLAVPVGSGVGNAVFWDQAMNDDSSLSESLQPWKWDKRRRMLGALNALLGAGGGAMIRHGLSEHGSPLMVGTGAGTIALSPAKDLIMKALPAVDDARGLINEATGKIGEGGPTINVEPGGGDISPGMLAVLGGLGVAGLGGLAWAAHRQAGALGRAAGIDPRGRVRVTLPTRSPEDVETTIELPIEEMQLSKKIKEYLKRDTKRRLRSEGRERTHHRKARRIVDAEVVGGDEERKKKEAALLGAINLH